MGYLRFSMLVLLGLSGFVPTGRSGGKTLNVLSFGARGDGVTLNTSFIQAAIDSATAMGGGVVVVPRGKFLSGTLVLKSNVTLELREGATILGSINPADYQHLAFILAERQENISITGNGTIDGQGRKLALYLDSLFYAGKLDSSQYNLRRKRPENRPGDLKISDCKNVRVSGITVKNACGWVQTYRLCEDLIIDSIRVESDAYWNNDGIDIADCKKVRITHCFVNSADDGICLKSEDGADHWNEDIYIAECTVRSSGSAIKFGTSSVGGFKKVRIKNIHVFDTFRSAIALESVDGGDLEDVDIDHIVATNTGDGIFIRLGQRNKNGKTGTLRNVAIRNVKVQIPFDRPDKNYDLRGPDLPFFHNPFPCSITGVPGHPVENVTLENIEITFPGRGNDGLAIIPLNRLKDVDENEAGYPEFSMFGELPSWGFYVRHVDGLTMKNITVRAAEKDFRPAFVFDDVNKLDLNTITIGKANNNVPVILSHVTRKGIQKVIAPGFAGNPVKTIESIPPVTAQSLSPQQWLLKGDWKMQSGVTDTSQGTRISMAAFDAKDWYTVSVPTTIIAGLIANKVYPFDVFMGQNLQKLSDPKLDKPWWFRREFDLPKATEGRHILLKLHGINYTAGVWLNGMKVADSSQVKGPFRIIELDITKYIRYDGENVLALQITRPLRPNRDGGDLAINYADWMPDPPDYNAGIVNDVELISYDKVGVEYPLVTTHFDLPALTVAHLSVDAQVTNYENKEEDAIVKGDINGNIHFEKKIHLKALESTDISWVPADFPQLNIPDPRIWWPWQYGKPELNHVELSVEVDGKVHHTVRANFGIREIASRLIDDQSREFIVNGRPIMLRGAAWSPDIFQRRSEERQEQEIRLVRDMNMNIIRSEGKLEDDHFYDLCDKYGILVMTGWMCCGAWQHPEHWDPAERAVALASDSSIMYWLRNKACLMVWLNGSDMPPTDASLERAYLDIEKSLKWPNPVIASADGRKSKVSGSSGVKMLGPYEWVPPVYWETDATKNFGGAWSFATEISPGPSIPPYESLIKFIPADSLMVSSTSFTSSLAWHYHSGTGFFATTDIFNEALIARYGAYSSIKNYTAKAQAQNYEAHRAMMEAYGLHKYNTATGVVQWMLSNPWPGLIWHTYDYYLYAGGTYFGMKKAMEPLHVMYSYASNSVAIINSLLRKFPDLQLQVSVYNLDGARKYTQTLTTGVDEDAVKLCLSLPAFIDGLSDTYFLRLELKDLNGKVHSVNWYWLSKKGDTLNWKKSNWYTTPESSYADYSALQDMPKTTLEISYTCVMAGDSAHYELKMTNTGKVVAFFVRLRALKGKDGGDILPLIVGDNYISLAPGETRTIRCSYRDKDAGGGAPYFLLSAWNLDPSGSRGDADIGFEEGLPR